jgi:hypothetical protein
MVCQNCLLEVTPLVIQNCQKPSCTYKEQPNTSGKTQRLFKIAGSGFIITPKKESYDH